MKIHLTDIEATYLSKEEWFKKEMADTKTKATACGYLRKSTTSITSEVTCKLCKKVMS